ncbi:MAG: hypothetical protein M1840_005252 [Geoglossum simile]|nr:MAG: hypothetical protein M1840_005252 [Geoglossum simile]
MAFSPLPDIEIPIAVYTDTSQIPFQHIEHLGSGTYAVIDAVKHIPSGVCFARKIIKHRMFSTERTAKAVLEEARIIRKLAHPHIISIRGMYEEPRGFGMLLSPVADGDLVWFLKACDEENFPIERLSLIGDWFYCLGNGLAYIHRQMIRHKDVKPSNILVKDGMVLYTDFGIAYDFETEATSSTEGYGRHTPMYSAPEVIELQERSRSSDIFSLGCVFSEMLNTLTRRTAASFYEYRINDTSHAYYATLDKNFGYWDIIKSMLSKVRGKRPSARQVIVALSEKAITSKCKNCGRVANRLRGEALDPTNRQEMATAWRETYLPRLMSPAPGDVRLHWVAEFEETFPSLKALCWAVETEEEEVVRILLDQGVDIRGDDGPGLPLLFRIIELGNFRILQLLLGKGANPSNFAEIGGDICTALHYACVKGHIRIVDTLLAAGAEIDACPGVYEQTALQVAASLGHAKIVDLLLTAGADCNWGVRGTQRTALQAAARSGFERMVEMLIARYANINVDPAENFGRTALQAASEGGHMGVVRQLLAAGANINASPAKSYGRTALQAAAEKGHLEIARLLLTAGADLFAPPSVRCGLTALQAAAYGGHLNLVREFIKEGAVIGEDPRRRPGTYGTTGGGKERSS